MNRALAFVALLVVVIVFTFATLPAYACACGGAPTPESSAHYVVWFNSHTDEWRAQANALPPAGYVFAEDYSMVPLSFYGY